MNIEVMSRRDFEKYAKESHRLTSAVVSISSYWGVIPNADCNKTNKISKIGHWFFNDTDGRSEYDHAMNALQAIEIVQFVRMMEGHVDKLIVHCDAGQSRSAGVAAAFLKYYTGSDMAIFNNRKYTPNMRCYTLVLNELFSWYTII